MTVKPQDARRARRFSVDVETAIVVDGQPNIPARARDLSRTGICLISGQPVDRGKSVGLKLVLAFSNDAVSEPLTLEARVVWCTSIAESFQIGAMFEEVSEEQDSFLEMFLHFLDGTLAPSGVANVDYEDTDQLPLSPEDKDDPFRD